MVSGGDPVGSFVRVVKDAFGHLELGFSRAVRDLELWNLELLSKLNGSERKKLGRDETLALIAGEERKKVFSVPRLPVGSFVEFVLPNSRKVEGSKKTERKGERDSSCSNCLQFALVWSLLLDGFMQALPSPLKSAKKNAKKQGNQGKDDDPKRSTHWKFDQKKCKSNSCRDSKGNPGYLDSEEGALMSLELLIGYAFCNLVQNVQKWDQSFQDKRSNNCDQSSQADHLKSIAAIINGKKADVDLLFSNLLFARMGGAPSSLMTSSSVKEDHEEDTRGASKEDPYSSPPQKLASGLLSIPLSNVEKLKSSLPTVSLTELIEFLPLLGKSAIDHPDKKKLFSVQGFFRYCEYEGRKFFEELDRDGDGHVTLEDLEIAVRKRKLPRRYARNFLRRTRRSLFSKSIGWKQFLSLMEQKEPTILRAYTTLCLSKSGMLQKSQVLTSLRSAGLPASEDNAIAMMRYLNSDTGESISYSQFRNFMLLLPSERLEDDPRSIWFEAATVVAVPPPVQISAESVLKSALAGGLASALSTSLLHPIDSMKTRVQASTLSFPELISRLPEIGVRGLYRGSIPAILGQFSSHGVRTGIFEASKLVLVNVAPALPEIQVQSIASFCSTILGTAVRIPCEVLKQRLQAGIFDNVGDAIVGTLRQDGLKGFFRGTGATLCREVPFYVAGMCLYAEAKKAAQNLLNRELEPWETIAVGALSGGFAAVVTTPFDVMKTRMMTAPLGMPVSMHMVAFSILQQEGPLGLFKGAVPRFFWIAPLGAMNFAGYELARKAMDEAKDAPDHQFPEKGVTAGAQ